MKTQQATAKNIFSPATYNDSVLPVLLRELRRFACLLAQYDIQVAIDSPAALLAWQEIPDTLKSAILQNFGSYSRLCQDVHASGASLRDHSALLTSALRKAGLSAPEDLKKFVTGDNIAEIYNLGHVQTFRSINFFDYCNYSLLDLLAREWFVLYERLQSITDQAMIEFLDAIRSGQLRSLTIPEHILKERDSNPRGVFLFDFQYCSPLFFANGETGGYLLTENVKELEVFVAGENKFSFLRR